MAFLDEAHRLLIGAAIAIHATARAQDWRVIDNVAPTSSLAAFDPVRDRVLAIGSAHETVEWDGTRWLSRPVAPLPTFLLNNLVFDSVRGVAVALAATFLIGPTQTFEFDGTSWRQRTTAIGPPQRLGTAMAFDSLRGRTVLFGGVDFTGTSTGTNETWEWDGIAWSQRTPASSPPVRAVTAMAFDSARGRTVLFGGHVSAPFSTTPLNDTWEWDGTTWTQRFPATAPSPRSGSRLAYDSVRQVMVMFGATQLTTGETWEYDGLNWAQRAGPQPPARSGPGLVFDSRRARTVLFGGFSGTGLRDVWEWDGLTWTQRLSAQAPDYRVRPGLAYSASRARLVLFGGSGSPGMLADTWEWDGRRWFQLAPPTSPSARYQHSTWSDGTDVFVFGGGTSGSPFGNDTWRFDGTTWTQMPSATAPPVRHSASIAYDPTTGGALMFGGQQPGSSVTYFGDTWRWSPAGWTQVAVTPSPSPRGLAAMAADPRRRRIMLWGGLGTGAPVDTWEWDGASWLRQSPVHHPSSGVGSMAFEPTLGAIVLQSRSAAFPPDLLQETWLWSGTDWLRLATPTQVLAAEVASAGAPGRILDFDGERLHQLVQQPPLASSYGARCPASGPRLFADTWARPGTADFGLSSAGHPASAPVLFVVGTAVASVPVAGCTSLVQPGGPLRALVADAAGTCTLPIPLPAVPALVGLRAFGQAWGLCPTGICATNGVDLTIGS